MAMAMAMAMAKEMFETGFQGFLAQFNKYLAANLLDLTYLKLIKFPENSLLVLSTTLV